MVTNQNVREGYKMTELGEIPVEWGIIQIGNVLKESKECNEPNYPLLSITRSDGVIPQSNTVKRDVSAKDKTKYKVLRPGRFVYNTMRMWQGVSAVSNLTGIISPAYTVCNLDEHKLNPQFVSYLFKTPKMVNQFHRFSQGLVDDTLNLKYDSFSKLYMVLPCLKEQQKIAEILSTVDEQIENTEQLIEKTKELKKGLMQQLLTKGIGHTEFKQTELGEIPVEWEVYSFGDLLKFVGSGVTPRGGREVYQEEGIIFIRSQNVHFGGLRLEDVAYISEDIHEKMKRTHVYPNDVLLNITGASIGRCAVVPHSISSANVNQHVCILRTNKGLLPDFLQYFISSSYGQKQIFQQQLGQTREGLNFAQVKSMKIILPSHNEQQKIASILSSVDEQIENYEQEKEKYLELKKGLMQQLLTGKIRVTV